jgi:putative peptide zinc metalloprotease protein
VSEVKPMHTSSKTTPRAPRLATGDAARFYPIGAAEPLRGHVVAIDTTRARQLPYPMLASRYKGPVTVSADRDTLTPNPPVFPVPVQPDTAPPARWETRGQLQIDGERRSLLIEVGTHRIAAVVRESGF